MMATFAQVASVHYHFYSKGVLPAWHREDREDSELRFQPEYAGLTMRASDMISWRLLLTIVLKAYYHRLIVTNPTGIPNCVEQCCCAVLGTVTRICGTVGNSHTPPV